MSSAQKTVLFTSGSAQNPYTLWNFIRMSLFQIHEQLT